MQVVTSAAKKEQKLTDTSAAITVITQDDLLRMVRKKLRRDHGFAGGEGNRYGVRCVWSAEKPVFPWADGTCAATPEPGGNLRLDCATGFGTAVFVTGAFGLVAAQEAVNLLLHRKGA